MGKSCVQGPPYREGLHSLKLSEFWNTGVTGTVSEKSPGTIVDEYLPLSASGLAKGRILPILITHGFGLPSDLDKTVAVAVAVIYMESSYQAK